MPKDIAFQKDKTGRSFLKKWFELFWWLGYCQAKDTAFCLPCIKHSTNTKVTVFTKIGFNDWVHAMHGFKKHEHSYIHERCSEVWRISVSRVQS